jgi:hypothetical protein
MGWALLLAPTDWAPKERPEGDTVAFVEVPVPPRVTVWGLPAALSAMVTDADRLPLAAGVNFTLIVQLAPVATEAGQLLVWAKSLEFVPKMLMPVTDSGAVPVLVRVTVWAALVVATDWFPKARLDGDALASDAVPVPVRLTDCGLPVALSAIASDAERLPLAAGVKVMSIVQLELAASELPQLLDCAKSLALVPKIAMLVIVRAALPELLTVTDWTALDVLTGVFPKDRLDGEALTEAEVPVPDRGTDWGLPVALSATLIEAERLPLAAGVKVTLTVQLAPAATDVPQLLVWEKSVALTPKIAMLVMPSGPFPEFVIVTGW